MKNRKIVQQLPSEEILNSIVNFVLERQNHKAERKKVNHLCVFLLCWKAGLRVNEAINFDLRLNHPFNEFKDFFLLLGKGKKKRYVYVSPEIKETLQKYNWEPDRVNRIGLWNFMNKIKRDMKLDESIELSPHTLRRCFATYNLLAGMPLNVLKQYLGHSKVTTTALYVKDSNIIELLRFKPIS